MRDAIRQKKEATGLEREGIFWEMTLDMGIKYERQWVEWCREAIEKIESMDNSLNEIQQEIKYDK